MREFLVIGMVVALTFSFFIFYVVPGLRLNKKIRSIRKKLLVTQKNTVPTQVQALFAEDLDLQQIWQEYEKTLHQQQAVGHGEWKVTGVFSTATADAYFHPESIFEGRIHSEFFKHLPGILTGLGIIGTFLGLVVGLHNFAGIELGNPQATQAALQKLMNAVSGAFEVSASAIIAAVFITLVEKYLFKDLTAEVHKLTQAIDALYDARSTEDYLAKLVKASEECVAQTKILKDSVIQEIGRCLAQLTEKQNAHRGPSLGDEIAAAIGQRFNDGLHTLAEVMQTAMGEQSAATAKLWQTQASDFQRLHQDSTQNINGAAQALQALVQVLQNTTIKSTPAWPEIDAVKSAPAEALFEASFELPFAANSDDETMGLSGPRHDWQE